MRSRRTGWAVAGWALVLLVVFAGASGAAPISGNLNGTGSFVLTNGVVTFTNLGPIGGGVFVVDPTSTGFFVTLGGTTATIQPLSAALEPPGVAVNIPNWMTFSAAPTVSVTLNLVSSGIYTAASCLAAPAAGQNCTPPGSPFNFTNLTATSSIVSFGIVGTVVDTSSPGQTSTFSGMFTGQFGSDYQTVLASIAGGGFVTTTYSAGFVATPSGITTPTSTPPVTNTPTNSPTNTPTSTPTNTPPNTPTSTPTNSPTTTQTNAPTSTSTIPATAPSVQVPTLSFPMMTLFALLLAGAGFFLMRRS